MKAIALGGRLARDLGEKSVIDLTADARLEILDAINGGLQKLHPLSSWQSKTTTGSIPLESPVTVSIGVVNGSAEVTDTTFSSDQYYRTIRLDGDLIDNQIIGPTSLLHPYGGQTGTVNAVIYCDAVSIVEPYDELVGDPRILETDTVLVNARHRCRTLRKSVARPCFYHVEANARNQNSPAPSVIRFDTLPDTLYRLEGQFTLAPARVAFSDLLVPGADVPLRAEFVEAYLLPVARGILASSSLWKDKESKAQARNEAEAAERKYEDLIPRTLSTPHNVVRTKPGF